MISWTWTLSGRRYPRAQLQAWSRDRSCRRDPGTAAADVVQGPQLPVIALDSVAGVRPGPAGDVQLDLDLIRPAISLSAAAGVHPGLQLQAFALDCSCRRSPWIALPMIKIDNGSF